MRPVVLDSCFLSAAQQRQIDFDSDRESTGNPMIFIHQVDAFSRYELVFGSDMSETKSSKATDWSTRSQNVWSIPQPLSSNESGWWLYLRWFLCVDFCVSFWILLVLVLDQGRPKSKVLRSRWQVLPVWLGIWSFRNLFFCRIGPLVSRIFHPRWTRTRPIGTVAPPLAKWSHYVSLSYHHEQEIGGRPRLKTLDTGAPMQPSSAWGKPYV